MNEEKRDFHLQVITDLAKGLVDNKKALIVKAEPMATSVTYTIESDISDYPKLIGKGGRTVRCFHDIANRMSRQSNFTNMVHLLEPKNTDRKQDKPFLFNPNWNPENGFMSLLERVLKCCLSNKYQIQKRAIGRIFHVDILLHENDSLNPNLIESLHMIFHNIGRANGGLIHVNIVPS